LVAGTRIAAWGKQRHEPGSCRRISVLDDFSLYDPGLLLLAVITVLVLVVCSLLVLRKVSRM